jgi:hypothetical protein
MYEELFGESSPGRPPWDVPSTGAATLTGDKSLTERARRRATRVLKHLHADEFAALMQAEIEYLRNTPEGSAEGRVECSGKK